MDKLVKLAEGTQLTVGSHKVEILQYLSEGGFAHIYKVRIDPKEEGTDIGCLKRVIIPDKTGLDQLRKEVEVMKRLRHSRCVVKYFDSHAERLDSGAYQVLVLMELCPNKSLLDFMNAKIKTKLTEPEILQIMIDISIAVFEMHKVKMIHRDIKIENVLLDVNCRYKLADFGSTSGPIKAPQTPQEFQALSHDITYQTTPQYRSPEMIDLYRGFPIDEKADIWALGCFLYKLCYYTTPFEANGEIAILHASYQFPPAPVYSGDLQNLIIIMLQENPIFRPNIVQVIKLVAALSKLDFNSLGIEDIYKAGSYNFQALHEYQSQKHQEMMRQQMYYEQQAQQQVQDKDQDKLDVQPSDEFVDPIIDETKDSKEDSESDLNVSLGDYENMDNIEERYPSLENIIAKSETSKSGETPKSGATSVKSGGTTEATSAALNKSGKQDDSGLETPETSTQYTQSQTQSPYQQQSGFPVHSMNYPQQPAVLPPHELQLLSPEQLQQYNYQHQAYHYQMNQWIYMKQQQQTQPQPQRQQAPSYARSNKSSFDMKSRTDSSGMNYPELQNKEAWEQSHHRVNEDAGKLADDIFGSKSRSPAETSEPQRRSQSVKSEPATANFEDEIDEEKEKEKEKAKSANSSELNLAEFKKEATKETESTRVKTSKAVDPSKVVTSKVETSDAADNTRKEIEETEIDSMTPSNLKLLDGEAQQPERPPMKPERPKSYVTAKEMPKESLPHYVSSSVVPTSASLQNKNPFPVKDSDAPEYKFPDPLEPAKTMDPQRSSNPWGDYRSSQPLPKANEGLESRISSLKIKDMNISPTASRNPSNEEPNLIDLDLEQSQQQESASSTPKMGPSEAYNNIQGGDSLIDLDLEGQTPKPRAEKPHFKKKTSGIPNPADFKVQEQVIDWASDDENPEHGSKMSRISIRNSLKQSRKSGEHKRSESNSSEHKHRISRLMSNN